MEGTTRLSAPTEYLDLEGKTKATQYIPESKI